jgi:hypothetical protein
LKLLQNTNIHTASFVVIAPAVLVGIVGIICSAIAPKLDGVSFYTLVCFSQGVQIANSVRLGALGIIIICVTPTFLKLDDDFKLGREIRAMLIWISFLFGFLISWSFPSGFETLIINSRTASFMLGVVFSPIEVAIQGIYPIWLSIMHERKEFAFKNGGTSKSRWLWASIGSLKGSKASMTQSDYRANSKQGLLENSHVSNTPITKKSSLMQDCLVELMDSQEGRTAFLHFLEREFAVENLMFYEACVEFKDRFSSPEVNQQVALEQAKAICNTFLKDGATHQVNLAYLCREKILDSIQTKETMAKQGLGFKIDPTEFDEATTEIFNLMAIDSFRRFRMTGEYSKFSSVS